MNDHDDTPEELDFDESALPEQEDEFWEGYQAAIAEGLRLVRERVERCQNGGELRYPDLRALEDEFRALLDPDQ